MAPLRIESNPGSRPGFFTMNAIISAGSPPISKNSNPPSSTKSRKARCVANRTRCPYFCSSVPIATNGCMSPREPMTWITMLRCNGKSFPASAGTPSELSWSSISSSSEGMGVRWIWFRSPAMLGLR